ncbi:hypothetical protein CUMW_186750 [Citrus unshiu]|nr:hypothetical protein CUMW_186750 [Citrus unshiu]
MEVKKTKIGSQSLQRMNGGHAFGKQRFGNLECMCWALKEEIINWPFALWVKRVLGFRKFSKEIILKGLEATGGAELETQGFKTEKKNLQQFGFPMAEFFSFIAPHSKEEWDNKRSIITTTVTTNKKSSEIHQLAKTIHRMNDFKLPGPKAEFPTQIYHITSSSMLRAEFLMESSEKPGRGKNPNAGGIFPPPFRETRTTKKARFRDEEVADDTPVQVSYKEILVNSSRATETGYEGGTVDWEFEEWDAIRSTWSATMQGARWAVCDGARTRFWLDCWATKQGPLINLAEHPVPQELVNATVRDFNNVHGSWNWPVFEHLLPSCILLQIASVMPPDPRLGVDKIFWRFDPRGNFTVLHAKLKTKDELSRRHIHVSLGCERCGAPLEDIIHVLRDCHCIKRLWLRLVPDRNQLSFFQSSLREWTIANLQNKWQIACPLTWECIFGVTFWRLCRVFID